MRITVASLPRTGLLVALVLVASMAPPAPAGSEDRTAEVRFPLESRDGLELVDSAVEIVTYRGRRAVRLANSPGSMPGEQRLLAILEGSDFQNGTIEVQVAGSPRPDAPPDMRGFVGIGFRVRPRGLQYENIYLRPTNGRADDQLRRNHSVQYESVPDFPWHRLRKEAPGQYEAYADLETGAWTPIKIVVAGTRAELYVHGAPQPCLIVKDLKLGKGGGRIGLWAHGTTEAYFSDLVLRRAEAPPPR